MEDLEKKAQLLAGELAAMTGVSTDTLRHYERKCVLQRPIRGANGYRKYPVSAIERVNLMRSALAVGFTLDELARFLSERDKGRAPCRGVHSLALEKLRQLDEQISSLTALRKTLKNFVGNWEKRLTDPDRDGKLGLLESLPSEHSETTRKKRKGFAGARTSVSPKPHIGE